LKVIILQISSRITIIAATLLAIGIGANASAATDANLASPFKAGPGVSSNVVSVTLTSTGPMVTLSGMRSAYTFTATDTSGGIALTVRHNATGVTTPYAGPIRFKFSDMNVAWNNWYNRGPAATEYMDSEAPAQVVRLYYAAFGRAPDVVSVGTLLQKRDDGMPLREVAGILSRSAELSSLSNEQYLEKIYRNVFHSEMPLEWRNSWIARWAQFATIGINNAQARAEFLSFYAEMETNRLSMFEVYRNGVDYKPAAPVALPPINPTCPRCNLP
jgi:hypothetical protein